MVENYYTVDQVSEMIKMHPKTVRRFIREGKLKANKVGKQWRITGHELSVFTEGSIKKNADYPIDDVEYSIDEQEVKQYGKASVSTVVDIIVEDMDEGSRISNMLMAVMNNKDPEYGHSTLNIQFIEKKSKVRIMLWGTIPFVEAMLAAIGGLVNE